MDKQLIDAIIVTVYFLFMLSIILIDNPNQQFMNEMDTI